MFISSMKKDWENKYISDNFLALFLYECQLVASSFYACSTGQPISFMNSSFCKRIGFKLPIIEVTYGVLGFVLDMTRLFGSGIGGGAGVGTGGTSIGGVRWTNYVYWEDIKRWFKLSPLELVFIEVEHKRFLPE